MNDKEVRNLQNKLNKSRKAMERHKKKYRELRSKMILMRREILKEMKDLEEKIKDIMYLEER